MALANLKVKKSPSAKQSRNLYKQDGNGRDDMIRVFNFLRKKKGVKRVLCVHVDDTETPGHSDEMIEQAIVGWRSKPGTGRSMIYVLRLSALLHQTYERSTFIGVATMLSCRDGVSRED